MLIIVVWVRVMFWSILKQPNFHSNLLSATFEGGEVQVQVLHGAWWRIWVTEKRKVFLQTIVNLIFITITTVKCVK